MKTNNKRQRTAEAEIYRKTRYMGVLKIIVIIMLAFRQYSAESDAIPPGSLHQTQPFSYNKPGPAL